MPNDERLLLDNFDAGKIPTFLRRLYLVSETHGTERLRSVKQAADTLEQRYERASEVFNKFAEWHILWREKTIAEDRPTDFNGRDLMMRIKVSRRYPNRS